MSKNTKVLRWGVIGAIALIVLYLLTLIGDDSRAYQSVDTSVAMEQLHNHNAKEVQIDDREILMELVVDADGSPAQHAHGGAVAPTLTAWRILGVNWWLLGAGLAGALSTFSTAVVQVARRVRAGEWGTALALAGVTWVVCAGAARLGAELGVALA